MSTELGTLTCAIDDIKFTEYHGGALGLCLQLSPEEGTQYIQLTRRDAISLALELVEKFVKPNARIDESAYLSTAIAHLQLALVYHEGRNKFEEDKSSQ